MQRKILYNFSFYCIYPLCISIYFRENKNNGLSPIFSSVKDIPVKQNLQPSGLQPLAVGQPGLTVELWHGRYSPSYHTAGYHQLVSKSNIRTLIQICTLLLCNHHISGAPFTQVLCLKCSKGEQWQISLILAVKGIIYCSVKSRRCSLTQCHKNCLWSDAFSLIVLQLHYCTYMIKCIIQQTERNFDWTIK